MPTYCFRCLTCNRVFERVLPIAEREDGQICHCGGPGKRDIVSEQRTVGMPAKGWATGLVSTSLGVHPEQVPEERERLKKLTGHDIEFTRDGNPVLRSRAQRRAVMKAVGMHDKEGGFGDG